MSEGTQERVQVKLDLKPGHHGRHPVVEIVPGPHPYLWIGDDDTCYGTVSGPQFRKLVRALNPTLEPLLRWLDEQIEREAGNGDSVAAGREQGYHRVRSYLTESEAPDA